MSGDFIYGDGGDDTLDGGIGNDYLDGGAGADAMTGGTGYDRYYVDDLGDSVIEDPNGGYDRVYSSVDHVLSANVEELHLLAGASAG